MRFTRRLIAVAFLALYAGQVVGGLPVHLWQHLSGTCCGEGHCPAASNHSRQHHHHEGRCHHQSEDAEDEQQDGGHSPGKNRPHDSSTCSVCQVLGQAQDTPVDLETTVSLAVSPATVSVLPEFYPFPSRSGFRSRAPPAFQV